MKNRFDLKKYIPIIFLFFILACMNLFDFLSFFFLLFSSNSFIFFLLFAFSSSSSFFVSFFESISISSSFSSSSSFSNLNLFFISSKFFKYTSNLCELKLISLSRKYISFEYILKTRNINPITIKANITNRKTRLYGNSEKFFWIFSSFCLDLNDTI